MKKTIIRGTITIEKGERKLKVISKIVAIVLVMIVIIYRLSNIVQANETKEIVLVIDPGHGGKMTGTANSELGLVERDITLKIARYLRDYLNEYEGIKVIMTHDGLPSDYEMELPDRGMVARNNNADMMISLHLNDYATPNQQGAEVFVTANKLLPKYNQESTRFGNLVLNELSKLGIENRGVKTKLCGDTGPKWEYSDGSVADYYAVIRYPMKGDGEDRGVNLANGEGIPGVLIEHCFMKGYDARFIDSETDIQNLARADCNALVAFYGLERKDSTRVSTITLNKKNMILLEGRKEILTASIKPDTAVNKNVIWSSSNDEIASVSQNGEVTAKKKGTAQITARTQDREKIATCTVMVEEVNITLSKKETNLLEGKTEQIAYSVTPKIAKKETVTWISSDETIVTVSEKGILTAVKEGRAVVTGKIDQENKKVELIVNVHTLQDGQNIQIKGLKEENGKISKIPEMTTVSDFRKKFVLSDDLIMEVTDKTNKILTEEQYAGTNTNIRIKSKSTQGILQDYTCIMYADVNEDGEITASDYVLIKNHIMEVTDIYDANQKKAADVNCDEEISAGDYVLIKNHIMDVRKLELK